MKTTFCKLTYEVMNGRDWVFVVTEDRFTTKEMRMLKYKPFMIIFAKYFKAKGTDHKILGIRHVTVTEI